MFLFETLPFELTFDILFRHGGFDSLESVLGTHACWEFKKLMGFTRRADLLCICRTVQLLDHPAHALFLLDYPPDSSIPENKRAWREAERCNIGWEPDTHSVVLAMRVFVAAFPRQVFPWLNTADLMMKLRSDAEWRFIGNQQRLGYKFNELWWNGQREAFHLERGAAKSDMSVVIQNTTRAEMERLFGALKRRELIEIRRSKGVKAWDRMKRAETDEFVAKSKRGGGSVMATVTFAEKKKAAEAAAKKKRAMEAAVVLTSTDKKKAEEAAKAGIKTLQSVLKSVQSALPSVIAGGRERIELLAKIIAVMGRNHPLIKWNLRQKLHTAAGRINISVWDVEFLLQRFQWEVMEDPLKQLLDLVVSRSL